VKILTKWSSQINILNIECDCGNNFEWPTNISLIECPKCQKQEWHKDDINFDDQFKVAQDWMP
jgi:Zn finger protein HypA/HybF involved in hydrogenase expression